MTLADLANIGEILGAVAVLVTLVYLAVQIRQGSATARAQTRQALADSQINYLNSRVTDPFLRDTFFKITSGQEIDEAEGLAYRVHVTAHIRLFENYFTQYTLGTMNAEDWRAMRAVIRAQFKLEPYQEAFYFREEIWNSNFTAEVKNIIGELGESAA